MGHPSAVENERTVAIVDRALLALWEVANQLSQVRPVADRFRVTLFGSSRVRPDSPLYADVRRLSQRLAAAGCDLITGGGPGLMQAANEGAQLGDPDDRTASVGIRIDLPFEQHANPFVEQLYTHRNFFSRLHHFARMSDAYVVVPGGIGTTLELVMVWQLLQVHHLVDVPLVLVGPMWADLVAWANRHMVDTDPAYAGAGDAALPTCVDDVEAAAEVIEERRARWQAERSRTSTPGDQDRPDPGPAGAPPSP